MSVDLSTLELRVNAEGGVRQLDRYTGSATRADRASSLLDSTLGKLGAAFGAFTVIKKFADETTAAQAAQAQLEAAIRSTGGAAGRTVEQLQSMAAKLQQVSTYSDDAVQGAQAVLLTFKKINGDTFDAATKSVVDLATRMGGDLNSAALQVGKALESPAEGLTALRRSGVSFTDAQADVIKKLVETNQLAEAQRLILAELSTEFGGSAVAARNTLGGALTAVKNAFGDLFEVSKDGSSAVVEALNKTTAFLSVLNNNRSIITDTAKYLGIAAGALFLYSQHAKVAAYWTGIVAGTQAIAGFVALARSIGLAGLAMELFSKAGILKIVSLVATVIAAGAAFLGLKSIMSDFQKGYAALQSDLSKPFAGGGTGAPGITPPGGVDQKTIDRVKSLNEANRDRVRIAQQALDVVGLEGLALERARVEQEATNAIIAARRDDLTKPQLEAALRSIELERQLKVATVETNDILTRRATLRADSEKRIAADIGAELKGIDERLTAAMAADEKYREDRRTKAARAVLAEVEAEQAIRDNFVRQLQQTFATGFANIIENGLTSFRSFFSTLKSLFIRTISDMLAASATRRLAGVFAGAPLGLASVANANVTAGRLSGATPYLGAAAAAGGVGYAVGGRTSNRGLGTLAGAASGAATGAAIGAFAGGPLAPLTATVGAVIGGLVGAIGGFIGASQKATQEAIAAASAQKALASSLEALRATFGNDALGSAIAQAKVQFEQLRKEAEAAYSGKKNESERNKVLAELNGLEARRIDLLREEYAESQKRLRLDFEIRKLAADGNIVEAEAKAFAKQQTEEYAALVKQGADATTLAAAQEALLAEARRRTADLAEQERRRIVDITSATRSFTDPRGASQAAFDEEASRRYNDAVTRGASAAELLAIQTYNLAAAIDRAAQIVEADTRVREGLIARGLASLGDVRGAQDASMGASQRQEIADAIRDGMSESNLALLQFVQLVEREELAMRRAIEDGTKAIQEAARKQIEAIDRQVSEEVARAADFKKQTGADIARARANETATLAALEVQAVAVESARDAQLSANDTQRSLLSALLDTTRSQLSVSEDALAVAQNAFAALNTFARDLPLSDSSTTSPVARLAESERQFDALLALASQGDAASAVDLPAAARAFLDASKGVNASGRGFQRDFARVESAVGALAGKFGGDASVLVGQVATLRSIAASTESQLASLDVVREAIVAAADMQLAVLSDLREAVESSARDEVEKLEKLLELDQSASDALLERLGADRLAVESEAARQIERLIAIETEAFKARVAASEYYATWRTITEQQGAKASDFYGEALTALRTPPPAITTVATAATAEAASAATNEDIVRQLRNLVEAQDAQLTALRQQIRLSVATAEENAKSMAEIAGSLREGNTITRRSIEGARL